MADVADGRDRRPWSSMQRIRCGNDRPQRHTTRLDPSSGPPGAKLGTRIPATPSVISFLAKVCVGGVIERASHIFPGAAELGHGDPGGVPNRRVSQINHSLAVNLIPAQCQWLGLEWKGLLRLCPGRLEAQREIEGFNADRVEAPAMQACAFPGFGVPGPSRVVRTERPPPKTNFRYSHQPQPGTSSCARIRLDRP